ncbi:MAG: hypothetical protein KDI39_15370 [Pseudomonadales bacterium]|nr:hypothetical protein [Pseudomonadales bacterium]
MLSRPKTHEEFVARRLNEFRTKCNQLSNDITLNPLDFKLYLDRHNVLSELEEHDLAAQDLTTLLEIDPEKRHYYYYMRHLQYLFMKKYTDALTDIKCAVETAPPNFNYYKNLAAVYQLLGLTDDAIAALSTSIDLNPDKAYYYKDRADFYVSIGQFQLAIEDATRAIELTPQYPQYPMRDRAEIYCLMKEFDLALKDCNACLERNPNSSYFYQTRSDVYAAMGNTQAARFDYERSCDLNPGINR